MVFKHWLHYTLYNITICQSCCNPWFNIEMSWPFIYIYISSLLLISLPYLLGLIFTWEIEYQRKEILGAILKKSLQVINFSAKLNCKAKIQMLCSHKYIRNHGFKNQNGAIERYTTNYWGYNFPNWLMEALCSNHSLNILLDDKIT